MLGASLAGVSHRLAGRVCEDVYGWALPAPGTLAMVVADGVGSAGRGGEGAGIAAGAACNYLFSLLSAATGSQMLACQGSLTPAPPASSASPTPATPGPSASSTPAPVSSILQSAGPSIARDVEPQGSSGLQKWADQACTDAIVAANEALLRAGGPSANELATTIVVAIVSLDLPASPAAQVTVGRVGDSSAFVLSSTGEWHELFVLPGSFAHGTEASDRLMGGATQVIPLSAEFKRRRGEGNGGQGGAPPQGQDCGASAAGGPVELGTARELGIASMLGTAGGPIELATAELGAGEALVLATDGVAEPLRDGPTTVAPRLAEVLSLGPRSALGPLDLAAAADFSRRGAHDDRTILVAWLVGGAQSHGHR